MSFRLSCIRLALLLAGMNCSATQATIYRWDNGAVIPGTEHIVPGPGVKMSERNLQYADLSQSGRGAPWNLAGALFDSTDLSKANLYSANLTNASLLSANLSGANLASSVLKDTNLAGAIVAGADFGNTTQRGLTAQQLYSTASYQARDLQTIQLTGNNLTGWNLSGQNLTNANFDSATLANADLSDAIVAGARFWRTTQNGLTKEQFYSTASYQARQLRGTSFFYNDLEGWNFSGQDLSNAGLTFAELTNADFSGAIIKGAVLAGATHVGFTKEHLYSTASYQSKQLQGINLSGIPVWFGLTSNLSGWDFGGQNLSGAAFLSANLRNANLSEAILHNVQFAYNDGQGAGLQADLAGANLTAADARGAFGLEVTKVSSANAILPDGRIAGLDLAAGKRLVVRDDDGIAESADSSLLRSAVNPRPPIPIRIHDHATFAEGGTLAVRFDADPWDSLVSFAPGIAVQLGGTLELAFSDDVEASSQLGRTIKVFDWSGVAPNGRFEIQSPYEWETSRLYTTGEVLLAAVPEPSAATLIALALCGVAAAPARSLQPANRNLAGLAGTVKAALEDGGPFERGVQMRLKVLWAKHLGET